MMKSTSETKLLAAKTAISEPGAMGKGILIETEINVTAELSLRETVKKDVRNIQEKVKKEINGKGELLIQDTVKKDILNIPEKVKNEINVKPELPLQDTAKKDVKGTSVKSKKESTKNKKCFYKDAAVQINIEEMIKIEFEDLTFEAGPSENYWQVIAERRRIALNDALDENKMLHERISTLQEENHLCNEMLNETRALVEVLQEMIGDDSNDIHNSLEDSALY